MKNYCLMVIVGVFCCSCYHPDYHSSNYFVSPNAHSLVDSYRDLVAKINVNQYPYDSLPKIKGNRNFVASAMSAKGYNEQNPLTPGYLTFVSYHWFGYKFLQDPNQSTKKATASFNTSWLYGSDTLQFVNFENCLPKPIVFPSKLGHNNSFIAIVVPVEAFQSSKVLEVIVENDAGYVKSPLLDLAISTNDIKAINDIYIEEDGGYMSKKLTTNYNNTHSSVGLICEVLLKSEKSEKCYIFNNYDGGGTLIWKVKKVK